MKIDLGHQVSESLRFFRVLYGFFVFSRSYDHRKPKCKNTDVHKYHSSIPEDWIRRGKGF